MKCKEKTNTCCVGGDDKNELSNALNNATKITHRELSDEMKLNISKTINKLNSDGDGGWDKITGYVYTLLENQGANWWKTKV